MPPMKYTFVKFPSPTSLIRKLPRKYRLIMLKKMWVKPPWTKRLVIMVQGRCRKSAGVSPSRKMTSGLIKVTMKTNIFVAISNQMAFRLELL